MRRLNSRWQSQALVQMVLGLFLALFIGVLFAVDLHFRYSAAIERGKTAAQNFAEVLSEHTALTFENVERTLREAEKIRKDILEGEYPTPDDVNAALRLLTKSSPIVVAVGWTDAEGNVVAHSYAQPPPRSSIAGMPHFTVHRDNSGDQLYVSPPFRSTVSGKWLAAASLRLNNPDGTFAGVLTTPLDQSYFARIYRSIDLGENGSILLLHTGGLVLAREPALDDIIGKSFAGGNLLTEHLPYSESGSYETRSILDGQPRIAGYKTIRTLPLVQLVSYERSEVLKGWYRHILVFGPLVAVVVLVILIGTILLVRQTRSMAAQSAALVRKSSELEHINTHFNMALSEMPNGLVMWDAEQRIVIANNRYREMYRLKPEHVAPGVTLRQILETHLANGETSELSIDEYIKAITAQTEQVYVLADGRTIAVRRQPMPDGGWIATHQDITEHKRAENLLRTTLDTMDQGLIAADRDGGTTIMNARATDLLGLPREFAESRPHKSVILEYQRSIGEFPSDEFYAQVIRDIDERRHDIYERERPNGTVLEIRTVPTANGGFVRTYSDVTARRAADAALRQEKDRAEAAARATSEFLANMSHELRTPLTAIIGVSDMLLNHSQPPEKQRHYLEMQRSAGQGLLGVVNDILDFSKLEAGQFSLNVAPLSLSGLVRECLEVVSDQAQRKGVSLTANVAADVSDWVQGDAIRLRQVLLNLIGNAVKFTPSGTVCVAVEKITDGPHAVRFAVTDTGIGISSKDMATLFQRFAQADSSTTRRFGGTGLGLAISRQLVALMGGTIDVQSAPGRGSAFSFVVELPFCEEPLPEKDPIAPASRNSCRLLLAEDNAVNRELIKAMLEQAGHEVMTVSDGAEAVRMTVRNTFDAILMDVQMPSMDGYTATRTIRSATADRPGFPIIALTANALPGEAERCLEAGMNVHVAKPVDWPVLLATIERLVVEERRDAVRRPQDTIEAAPRPDASAQASVFDNAVLARLHSSIGDVNATRLLRLFSIEARQRFPPQSGETPDRIAICREAHSFGGAAGMLGFHALAKACGDLQFASDDTFDRHLVLCREARDVALEIVTDLIGEEDNSRPMQTSA